MHPYVHVALLVIGKVWKPARCPSVDEYMVKMCSPEYTCIQREYEKRTNKGQ